VSGHPHSLGGFCDRRLHLVQPIQITFAQGIVPLRVEGVQPPDKRMFFGHVHRRADPKVYRHGMVGFYLRRLRRGRSTIATKSNRATRRLAPPGSAVLGSTPMSDDFVPYRVVLAGGELSPAENLDTAITAARQIRASGLWVERIEQGEVIVLEGDALSEAIAKLPD
jgi:hypothetical protein